MALKADIYHLHDPELLQIAGTLLQTGAKVVYDAHEDLPRQILGKHYLPTSLRKPIAKLVEGYENNVAAKLSGIVAATPTIRDRFLKVNPHVVDVKNYPMLTEISGQSAWESKALTALYIGGILEVRGAFQMVDAIAQCPGARLELAGAYDPSSLRALLATKPGWQQVDELGFLDRPGVVAALARAKVGLVVLQPQANFVNSLPIKLFEYMAAGIPVVATDFPLWKQIVETHSCGLCVDATKAEAIAEAIQYLLTNDAEAKQMGLNGLAAVRSNYSWETEALRLIGFYESLF